MSLSIMLQTNNSEKNRLNKDLTTISTVTGTLRHETSIIDPIILIEGNISDYIQCNYITISEFRRSYFVNNIRSVRNEIFEISAHVDVLSSFASEIRTNSAIIHRQENEWNLYLDDGAFRVYQNPIILTKEFPSGFSTQEFILAVAGG